MDNPKAHLDTLYEIRDIMQKSSRFISLSGLSGVVAGIFALIGAAIAYYYLNLNILEPSDYVYNGEEFLFKDFIIFFFIDAIGILIAAIIGAIYFTTRKAKRIGQPIWDNTAKRLLINLFVPLAAGGLFCLALVYHYYFILVAPATLVFYGLALLNASKYTLHDIRYLAITEIGLGILGAFFIGYGLLLWTIGFGVMHIIYGTIMYYKYEQ